MKNAPPGPDEAAVLLLIDVECLLPSVNANDGPTGVIVRYSEQMRRQGDLVDREFIIAYKHLSHITLSLSAAPLNGRLNAVWIGNGVAEYLRDLHWGIGQIPHGFARGDERVDFKAQVQLHELEPRG